LQLKKYLRRHLRHVKANNDFDNFEKQYKIPCISVPRIKQKFEHSYGINFLECLENLGERIIKPDLSVIRMNDEQNDE
jgi:hypothetical protein